MLRRYQNYKNPAGDIDTLMDRLCISFFICRTERCFRCPENRFWIKLVATDVGVAIMESGRRVWNGDKDLGDGQLQKLRQEHDERFQLVDALKKQGVSVALLQQPYLRLLTNLMRTLCSWIVASKKHQSILKRSFGYLTAQKRLLRKQIER